MSATPVSARWLIGLATLLLAAVAFRFVETERHQPELWLIATAALVALAAIVAVALRPAPPIAAPPAVPLAVAAPSPAVADGRVSVEALADPALIVDHALRCLHANAAARALIGERIVGEDLRVQLRHPIVIEAAGLARDSDQPVTRELMGFGRPESVFRLRAVAIGDARVLIGFVDITQARLTERMRVDFVANASHELRTPLATLLGFIETLQGPAAEDEPARTRFLDIMGREAQRMSRLIDDLLSLSRIELDKYVPPRGNVALGPVIVDVGRTLAVRLDTDGRALRTDLPADLPEVVADRDQILQVLHNLVSNALKYGRPDTPIVIRAERVASRVPRGEPMVRVSVEDEGDGIAPEHLPRLTERFYRVDTSRSRSMGGTGLGLAIVKHIVERHRGQLGIASTQGEGTVFSFTLPEARPAPPALAAGASS